MLATGYVDAQHPLNLTSTRVAVVAGSASAGRKAEAYGAQLDSLRRFIYALLEILSMSSLVMFL